MSSSVDVIAPLREQGTTVNLSVLQQKDRAVQAVRFTAKHVVLYHLSPTHTWARQDIEGPLFIVQRATAPFYQIVILNRKSMTDWKQEVRTDMEGKMEINGKHLQFQSGNLVVTLWFHEEPECEKALKVLQQICPVADRPPQGVAAATQSAAYAQNQPPQQQQPQAHQFAPQPQQQQQPVVKPQNPQQPYQPYNMQQQPQPQQHQFAQPSQSQQPAYVSSQPSASPPASAPKPAFISPYAPPPPVAYNVALPSAGGSGGRQDDRELAQRLQGFLSQFNQADGQHTAEYQKALADEEERRRRNVQRFQEEEKRKKEAERAAQPPPASASAPPAATSAIFPRMLTADQHLMLQQFPSSSNLAPPNSGAQQQQQQQPSASPVAAAAPVDGLDRNLAAAKARKAARQQAAAQQNQPQQQQQQAGYSPSIGPSAYTPAAPSSLPLSLLLAAANSSANPPMPVLNSQQQSSSASSSSYAALSTGSMTSSPIVGPIRSPPLHAVPQSSPLASTSTPAAAASPASDLHPQLLAMLSLSVANQSAALPPMPVLSSHAPQPVTVVPASSPYAARASPDSFTAAAAPVASAAAPVLLAPSHFLTSATPTSSVAPASSPSAAAASVPRPIPAAPTKLRTASEFKDYLMFLCNDPATFDWLYQKYLANPAQHPFA